MNDRIKNHVKTYQSYYTAAGMIVVGVVAYKAGAKTVVAPVFNNTVSPVFNNTVNNGGHMTKFVKCLETGQIWETVTSAAEAAGTTISDMSRHINGHTDHVKGLHYAIVGLGTV